MRAHVGLDMCRAAKVNRLPDRICKCVRITDVLAQQPARVGHAVPRCHYDKAVGWKA
jgi:hypothetical protein